MHVRCPNLQHCTVAHEGFELDGKAAELGVFSVHESKLLDQQAEVLRAIKEYASRQVTKMGAKSLTQRFRLNRGC